ncbi:MAG: DNA damage-inducible protein D [Nanoarchaeota archaeon]|nr:DNA damage-inducible protein D [Nanoarchaeota archaeon]
MKGENSSNLGVNKTSYNSRMDINSKSNLLENSSKYSEFEKSFEELSKFDEQHLDFWYARDLQQLFDYPHWTEFERVIKKAQLACENGGNEIKSHFILTTRPFEVFGVQFKEVADYKLSRFATYLIIQNADPKFKVVAQAQSYFASKVRSVQIGDITSEEIKRVEMRRYLKSENIKLSRAAKKSGVSSSDDFSDFYNKGYEGLYGGLSAKEIHERKGLGEDEKILDFMSSTEMAANLFRVTQTKDILQKHDIKSAKAAKDIHFNVGHSIRKTIKEMGGVPPEYLETPKRSAQEVSKELLHKREGKKRIDDKKINQKISKKN